MTYTIVIKGQDITGVSETLTFQRACSSAAEMLGHVAMGTFSVKREVGKLKSGKPKMRLHALETSGQYTVLSLEGGGIRFDEVEGWKI